MDLVEEDVDLRVNSRVVVVKQGVNAIQAGMNEPFRRWVGTVGCAVVGVQEGVRSAGVERVEQGMALGVLCGVVAVVLAVGGGQPRMESAAVVGVQDRVQGGLFLWV